jgi:hypothetical protein
VPADALGKLLVGEAELIDELAIADAPDRIEILALEVLDEGEFELVAVGQLSNDRRDLSSPAAVAARSRRLGDKLVAVDRLGHKDRLDDAVLGDARRERGHGRIVDPLARLARVESDPRGRDLHLPGMSRAPLRDQRREAPAEARRALGPDGHDATNPWTASGGFGPRSAAGTEVAQRRPSLSERRRNSSAKRGRRLPAESGR